MLCRSRLIRSEKSSCNIHHLLDSNWPQFPRRGGKLRSIAAMDQICISSCSFSVNFALQHQSELLSSRCLMATRDYTVLSRHQSPAYRFPFGTACGYFQIGGDLPLLRGEV